MMPSTVDQPESEVTKNLMDGGPGHVTGSGGNPKVRRVAQWMVLIGAVLVTAIFLTRTTYNIAADPEVRRIVRDHYAATVGLPGAAFAALCLVMFLEGSSGAIELSFAGLRLKGAAGPILLWAVCFISITASIRLLWPLAN